MCTELAHKKQAMAAAYTARNRLEDAMAAVAAATPDTLPSALTASAEAHREYRTTMHIAVIPEASTAQARSVAPRQ